MSIRYEVFVHHLRMCRKGWTELRFVREWLELAWSPLHAPPEAPSAASSLIVSLATTTRWLFLHVFIHLFLYFIDHSFALLIIVRKMNAYIFYTTMSFITVYYPNARTITDVYSIYNEFLDFNLFLWSKIKNINYLNCKYYKRSLLIWGHYNALTFDSTQPFHKLWLTLC